jgi:hypothetical protein
MKNNMTRACGIGEAGAGELEVGKIYRSQYYLFLYKEKAMAVSCGAASVDAAAIPNWHMITQSSMSYCEPEAPLLVLSASGDYHEVLVGDSVGWIINKERLGLKDISRS